MRGMAKEADRFVAGGAWRWTAGALVAIVVGCGSDAQPRPASAMQTARHASSGARLSEAKDLFYAAVAGDRQALGEAGQILEALGGGRSSDPEVVAYLGACKLLEASHAIFFLQRAALGNEGLALEDRAVAAAPQDLEVRFLRGVTNYQLPRFLNRYSVARADLAMVAQVAEQAASEGRLDPRAAAADLDYHGKALEQQYDAAGAIRAWQAAVRVAPESPGGRDAAKHLAEHGSGE